MNSAVMEGFISQEMKSSHMRKSGHNRLIQLALIIICFFVSKKKKKSNTPKIPTYYLIFAEMSDVMKCQMS